MTTQSSVEHHEITKKEKNKMRKCNEKNINNDMA